MTHTDNDQRGSRSSGEPTDAFQQSFQAYVKAGMLLSEARRKALQEHNLSGVLHRFAAPQPQGIPAWREANERRARETIPMPPSLVGYYLPHGATQFCRDMRDETRRALRFAGGLTLLRSHFTLTENSTIAGNWWRGAVSVAWAHRLRPLLGEAWYAHWLTMAERHAYRTDRLRGPSGRTAPQSVNPAPPVTRDHP